MTIPPGRVFLRKLIIAYMECPANISKLEGANMAKGIFKTIVIYFVIVLIIGLLFGTKIRAMLAEAGLKETPWYGFGIGEYKGDMLK